MSNNLEMGLQIAKFLDNKFRVFGRRFGFAPIIDLLPQLGTIINTVLSLYLIFLALNLGLPKAKIFQMLFNISINFLFGWIPIIGSAVYIINRANIKNWQIIQDFRKKQLIYS